MNEEDLGRRTAEELHEAGRLEEAIALYTDLLRTSPNDDELLTATPDEERRANLITQLNTLCELGDDESEYPISSGPLCMYGSDPSKRSAYYDLCPDCKWGQEGGPGPSYVDSDMNPV